jgi:ABC-type bacteriocin/lantibiotic exporter with double-glycine peptidase domain
MAGTAGSCAPTSVDARDRSGAGAPRRPRGLAQPLAAREVIEALADDRSLLTSLLVLGGLVAFSAAIVALELWLLERTAERVVLGVRRDLAARLLRLRLSFRPRSPRRPRRAGHLRLHPARQLASTALVQLLAGTVTLLGAIMLMGVVDLVLLGVTVSVLVVVSLAAAVVLPRIMRATERQQEAVARSGGTRARAWRA